MSRELLKKRNVTSADAIRALAKNGVEVSEKDAEIILDFLYFLGKLSVDQYINTANNTNISTDENSRPICPGEY